MSPINDVLNLIRLEVEVYHNARVCGDWRINEHSLDATCFHMPTQGDCLLSIPTLGEWHLKEGDVVIFPKEMAHSMTPVIPMQGKQQHLPIADSQSIEGTSMLCGVVQFQHSGGERLVRLLPPILIIEAESVAQWLGPLKKMIVTESLMGAKMSSPILNRLCELLIAFSLRSFAEDQPHKNSILALYAHPKLLKSVEAMHRQVDHPWQLSSLANEAGMSRTRFSELFTQVAGMTAIQYLTWWRMQIAWSDLQAGHSVERVSERVGYRSEAAFARAFKKVFGHTVGTVRKSVRN